MKIKISILCLLILSGCKGEFASAEIKTSYEKVMFIHDEVMPEMSTINRLKRKLKKTNLKDSLTLEMITELDKAEDEMMDWMSEFKLDRKAAPQEQLSYLSSENVKISKVSAIMKNSISSAKDYLEKIENEE